MPEKPLLLPAAKRGLPFRGSSREYYIRLAALIVGGLMVLIGAADLMTRVAHAVLGNDAATQIFAPAPASAEVLSAASTTEGALIPARLKIPSIGVNAHVEQVGVKDDGSMGTPTAFGDVGWYAPGAKPGSEKGSAVIAGHVDNALTTAGVFEHLVQVKVGDYVVVEDAAGKSVIYKVISSQSYPANQAPLSQIFATDGAPQLVLITCTGNWVTSQKQFDERLVVVAVPAYPQNSLN
jgi:LPXTG-site transpeptidase (sortase) family protein